MKGFIYIEEDKSYTEPVCKLLAEKIKELFEQNHVDEASVFRTALNERIQNLMMFDSEEDENILTKEEGYEKKFIEINRRVFWEWHLKLHVILYFKELELDDDEVEYTIDFKINPDAQYDYGNYDEVKGYLDELLMKDALWIYYDKTYSSKIDVQKALIKLNKHNFSVEI